MLYMINYEREMLTVEMLHQEMSELASAPIEYDIEYMMAGIKKREALIPLAEDPINVYEVDGFYQLITK